MSSNFKLFKKETSACEKASSCASGTGVLYTSSTVHKRSRQQSLHSKVWVTRLLFLLSLCVVAVILGYTAGRLVSNSEIKLAEEQFASIAGRALDGALENTFRKRFGVIEMASIVSYGFPDAETWPFVHVNGYEQIASNVLSTSTGIDSNVALCVLVTPDQLPEFEEFAYNVVLKDKFPEGAGVSSFGPGVYGLDFSLNNTDKRFHETDGTTTWGSPYKIFAPFLYHSDGPALILMGNYRTLEARGKNIDEMISCSEVRAKSENVSSIECGTLTDIVSFGAVLKPQAVLHQPVYPANNRSKLTGLFTSTIAWGDVLEHIFADEVSGVVCVLETETQAYTWRVSQGKAILEGEGILHDAEFSKYRKTIALTSPGMFTDTSATYSLTMYPDEEFFKVYSTNNKVIATVGSVCIIIFTSLLFLLYDFFVRKEFHSQRAIMDAKRQFMRFVSHEVRTPLNSICMGLQLMQDEMHRFIRSQNSKDRQTMDPISTMKKGQLLQEKLSDWSDLNGDILKNAHSAVTVLSDLLNYDKIEQGTFQLELSVVPIWELVERTVAEFKFPAEIKTIDLQVDYNQLSVDPEAFADTESGNGVAASLLRDVREQNVVGDTIRITQVLRNFLSNAIKFTPEGGDITVRMSWKKPSTDADESTKTFVLERGDEVSFSQSGYVRVAVTDSGAGMSDDQLAKVFGEGVQFNVNELQVGQGSGLGLFIAKGIAEQHGGSLAVASKGLSHGTTFTLTLPLYHTPDSALPETLKHMQRLRVDASQRERGESFSSHPGNSLRILVVDDTTMNRKLLVRVLKNKGHVCEEAENGLVAVKKVETALENDNPYNTILMDYEMPVMNGPTASKEIRALGCDSFIVGVTGNLLPEDISFFNACGANCVLPKPLDLVDLEDLWMEHGVAMSMN